MPDLDPGLQALADAHGVATEYDDWAGKPVVVPPSAVVAALAALGVDASSPTAVAAALDAARDDAWRRLVPPTVVVRGNRGPLEVRVPGGESVSLHVVPDGGRGSVAVDAVAADGTERRVVPLALPDLPYGYHRLVAEASGGRRDEAALIVAPAQVEAADSPGRAWGWMVQLYSLRSRDSWAVGDYGDLRSVAEHAVRAGAGVLLVNPLHAETPVLPLNPSPYSPSSRRFRSPLYLRIAGLPEYGAAPAAVRSQVAALRPATDPDRVDRDAAWTAKLAALRLLWPLHDAAELASFREQEGSGLEDFALFCELAATHGRPWQEWPLEVRSPDAPGIPAFRSAHAEGIAFWCWLQLQVERQLADVAATGILVVHDLAVGVDAGGADAWALRDVLAMDTTVGAPPDSFNQQGQDWGLPPWRPDRLAAAGYAPYRDMVRACLRSAGGLRIDHVMGLFRLWWVPRGGGPAAGTYVRYDADALLAVLALEASRAGALVVGEDLGTVEDRVRDELESSRVLGSAVLWFERDEETEEFRPPDQWRELAMASVSTHDLPTAAGFLAEEQVRVRAELGQLGVDVEEERARVRAERAALTRMLTETGLLERYSDPVLAMHGALVSAPCRVVLASFGDAVGDLRQPNLPGTVDEYPNWRLPVADGDGRPLSLEELLEHPGVQRLTAVLQEGLRGVR